MSVHYYFFVGKQSSANFCSNTSGSSRSSSSANVKATRIFPPCRDLLNCRVYAGTSSFWSDSPALQYLRHSFSNLLQLSAISHRKSTDQCGGDPEPFLNTSDNHGRWSRMDTKHGCSSTTELVVYLTSGARLTAIRVPAPHTPELPAHSKQHHLKGLCNI